MNSTRIIYTALLILISISTFGQRKIIEKLTSNERDSTRSASFLPLPAIGYAQETGWEFGLATMYSFYADRRDALTRNSTISTITSISTKGQSNFNIKADVWSKQNKYHYIGDARYQNFPFNFYGVGNKTKEADEDKLDMKLTRFTAEVEKRILKRYYAGINSSFENFSFRDKESGGIYTTSPALKDKDGGRVVFVGLSQIYDTRNTNTFTTKGSYVKVNYSYAPDLFKGDNFTGSLFKVDLRTFKNLGAHSVFAFQTYYQTIQGDETPFYLLPQLGNDQLMRGYYSGRYRDENLLAAQAEFRYRFMPRFGVAAFLGAGNAYKNRSLDISEFKPSYGGGLRYFFEVERGVSVRFDYGVGEKRPGEKRLSGFYISFGEAF
jgi:outer membrane translocation and assembly module TamA